MTIPLIDFAAFDDAAARPGLAANIDAACRAAGFFCLFNHGIPQHIIDASFAAAADFFALPDAEKEKISIAKSPCHRGWYRIGEEVLDPVDNSDGDFKEGVKIGFDCPPDHPRRQAGIALHGANQWPDINGWQEVMQQAYQSCSALSRQIMQVLAMGLSLPDTFFDKWLIEPMATLSPIRYPPQYQQNQIGAGAHTDFGCLTLLFQRDIAGLEIQGKDGSWIDVPADPTMVVVNIGDMMARWTNDIYTSTRHRVINRAGQPRQSLAFFFDPDPDADLTALPSCLAPGDRPRYAPTTALAHLLEKIDASFSYRKDDKDCVTNA